MSHMRPGIKVKLWTGGFTDHPTVDPPWLLKLVSVLAILSIVGAILYAAIATIGASDLASLSNEDAIYVAVLHFFLPIAVLYTVTTNSPVSRFLILGYFVTVYFSTIAGKGFLGNFDVDPTVRFAALTAALIVVVLWLFRSPKMRFYFAVISGKPVPADLESKAATFMDDSKINPRVRVVIDWIADHLETVVLLGLAAAAVYACVEPGA